MENTFWGSKFDGDISEWNTSNVTNITEMFCNSTFNQDIFKWDTSKVTNMEGMLLKIQPRYFRMEHGN